MNCNDEITTESEDPEESMVDEISEYLTFLKIVLIFFPELHITLTKQVHFPDLEMIFTKQPITELIKITSSGNTFTR